MWHSPGGIGVYDVERLRVFAFVFILLGVLAAGCSKNDVPQGEPIAPEPVADQQSPQGLSFTAPEGWVEEAPNSAMRRGQYRLPGEAGDAELAIFAGIGGSVEQNIERWIGQFTSADGRPAAEVAKTSQREIKGYPVTFLDVEGDYSASMMPMGPPSETLKGYRMLAAVIETESGPWFLKLTGPAETVKQWESSFSEFVESVE